jgi:carbamoyltransferase
MKILGISAFYHDSSACLIEDGKIIAACQEERLSRVKHDSNFPSKSILYCLAQANCKPEDVTHIIFYEKPFLKFERLLETYLAFAPRGFKSFTKAIPLWLSEKLFQKKITQRRTY